MKCCVPLQQDLTVGSRVNLELGTHTHTRPRRGEDPHRKRNRASENKRKQKGPKLGMRGQKPETRNKKNKGTRFRVSDEGNNPKQRQKNNDLNLEDDERREGEQPEKEQAIPKRAKRKNTR